MSDAYMLTPKECNALQRKAYEAGQRDMLARCIAAVEGLPICNCDNFVFPSEGHTEHADWCNARRVDAALRDLLLEGSQ